MEIKFTGYVSKGVPYFYKNVLGSRISLTAIQILERENVELRLALAECENVPDNYSQEPTLDVNSFVDQICKSPSRDEADSRILSAGF